MAKMTIAQQREKAVYQLAQRKNLTPTEQDIQDARRTMNSFYRLCGLDEQLLYLENDEQTHDKPYTLEKAAKRDKWFDRLNTIFKKIIMLVWCISGTVLPLRERHNTGFIFKTFLQLRRF